MSEARFLPLNEAYEISRHSLELLSTAQECGPNDWDNISANDFGSSYDYELIEIGDTVIFYPVSNAALQWCYKYLPEDLDRWGSKGFVIEATNIDTVIAGAKRDNLMSEAEFDQAMNEEQLMLQGES